DILKKAQSITSKKEMKRLSNRLYDILKGRFEIIKEKGVKLALVTLPNNKVFLRLHKPSKFGDDISKVRYAVTQVNKTHKVIRGFEKGKISHALRNIYPIFDKNGVFLASFDISFDISLIEDKLSKVANIDTHLIIHKDILESRVIGYQGRELKYIKSVEHNDYMTRDLQNHKHDKSYEKNIGSSKLIQHNINKGDKFALYYEGEDEVEVVSFYPVRNIKDNKVVVWLVSHSDSPFIATTLLGVLIVRMIVFIGSLLLVYFLYRVLSQKYILDKRIANQTKELKESNSKLKNLSEYQETIIEGQIKVAIAERDRAQAYAKAKSEFLANMSHEIRTPLNAITGFIDILKDEDIGRKSLEYINIIDKSSQSLLRIIEDILDFSKIESGKLNIDHIDFDLYEEFQSTTDLFAEKCSKKNILLNVNLNDNLPQNINTDPLRLKQIISNLLSNAVKFTESNKNIYVDISYSNEELFVSIKDEGKGISSSKLEHIFESFNQEDNSTTRNFGGTGLGLTISSKLVELLGGQLEVKSKLGIGSEFYFSIPVKLGKNKKEISEASNENHTFNNEKILVVEDNKSNQMLIKIILKKLNLSIQFANDGLEGIDAFKANKYAVVLMDENMPNMNGMEATKHILEYERKNNLTHTPIIALTANAIKGDREMFLEAGMDEYLAKPIDKKQLVLILSKYIS
ncbi:MAG: ATP-binding protein, partial [Campylobacterota bacterium]|nr:ATP-binding protein [Campylobacterota bacterium]